MHTTRAFSSPAAQVESTQHQDAPAVELATNDAPHLADSISKRIFASSLVIPHTDLRLDEFDPTEVEYSETERDEVHASLHAGPITIALPQPKPGLLSIAELTNRLKEVNQDAGTYRNKRRQRRPPANPATTLLPLQDMINLLKHINLSEATHQPVRWDLIDSKTATIYDNCPAAASILDHDSDDEDDNDGSTSLESTRQQIFSMFQGEDDAVGDDEDDYHTMASGYTLAVSIQSCASSVSWPEGSLYDEITVGTAEEEASLYDEITIGTAEEEMLLGDEQENDVVSWASSSYHSLELAAARRVA